MKAVVVTTITTTIDTEADSEEDKVVHDMNVASDSLPQSLVVATALSACKAGVAAMEDYTEDYGPEPSDG